MIFFLAYASCWRIVGIVNTHTNTATGAANTTAARKPQHTRGPWRAVLGAFYATVCADNIGAVAALGGKVNQINTAEEGDIMRANARLIAAAPELLDALREIELLARDIKRSNNADAIVCKCMDVIAKAAA